MVCPWILFCYLTSNGPSSQFDGSHEVTQSFVLGSFLMNTTILIASYVLKETRVRNKGTPNICYGQQTVLNQKFIARIIFIMFVTWWRLNIGQTYSTCALITVNVIMHQIGCILVNLKYQMNNTKYPTLHESHSLVRIKV